MFQLRVGKIGSILRVKKLLLKDSDGDDDDDNVKIRDVQRPIVKMTFLLSLISTTAATTTMVVAASMTTPASRDVLWPSFTYFNVVTRSALRMLPKIFNLNGKKLKMTFAVNTHLLSKGTYQCTGDSSLDSEA